jgi:plasmid stabilization system protein ParE
LKPRRVRFTATAQRHVTREKTWWLENRLRSEVFATEFEEALRVLSLLPGAGTPYTAAGVPGLRRLYLRKLTCHLYYTFDEHNVIVRALWGARRRRDPTIKP